MPAATPLRSDLLSADTPLVAIILVLLVLGAGWWAFYHWRAKLFPTFLLRLAGIAARVLVGAGVLWCLWQSVGRFLAMETTWPLWTHSFLGSFCIEILLLLYGLEQRLVSHRLGRLLLALRLAGMLCLLIMLVQPLLAQMHKSDNQRHVAILLDDSGSMQISDPRMTIEEKMALAEFFQIPGLTELPPVGAAYQELAKQTTILAQMAQEMALPEGTLSEGEKALLNKRGKDYGKALENYDAASKALARLLRDSAELRTPEVEQALTESVRLLRDKGEKSLDRAVDALKTGDLFKLRAQMRLLEQNATRAALLGKPLRAQSDREFYEKLPGGVKGAVETVLGKKRRELALEALQRPVNGKPLLELLREKYGVELVRFARESAPAPEANLPAGDMTEDFRMRTDVSGALQKLTQTIGAERLAGVVLLSDARHNTETPVDDVARELGRYGAPIFPVVVGSARGSSDVSLMQVAAPQTVFQGDKVRVRAELSATNLRGKKCTVRLLCNEEEVAREEVTVPDDSYRTTLRLSYQPKATGIHKHRVVIYPVEDEVFANNNAWEFQTAVSDDRTNVLIIEDLPRWEFRYLRNLFDSRDKSVHLQYVLLSPDHLPNARPASRPASASAKFGESEATQLPASDAEWKKFDVIILGDLPPSALSEANWKTLRSCVEDRGALLVMVAGPNALPHAYTNEIFQALCPVTYTQSTQSHFTSPEPAYLLRLTPEGRSHYLMQQSSSAVETQRIWEQMPVLRWRHAITGVKPHGTVLAAAEPVTLDAADGAVPAPTVLTLDPAALTKKRAEEAQHALVVVAQSGVGKVAMLNFDQTWRFRYGVGDTYHHRFWGQMLRWGAGENLRGGSEFVRVGSDKLTYEPKESIQLAAKLIERDYAPVRDAQVYATITRGGEKISRTRLDFLADSHGMYQASVNPDLPPGDYQLALEGDAVERLSPDARAQTQFIISPNVNPIEFGDLSTDPETAQRLASLSGGRVLGLTSIGEVASLLGAPSQLKMERRETRFWDHWLLLTLGLACFFAEWLVRRRSGLV